MWENWNLSSDKSYLECICSCACHTGETNCRDFLSKSCWLFVCLINIIYTVHCLSSCSYCLISSRNRGEIMSQRILSESERNCLHWDIFWSGDRHGVWGAVQQCLSLAEDGVVDLLPFCLEIKRVFESLDNALGVLSQIFYFCSFLCESSSAWLISSKLEK